jgi:hypothetical protein
MATGEWVMFSFYSQHNGINIRNTGGEHTLLAELVLVACQDLLVLFS